MIWIKDNRKKSVSRDPATFPSYDQTDVCTT